MKHGKKYNAAKALVDRSKKYEISEAIDLAKKVSYTKFDPTLEVHIQTNANPKYNDQQLRWTVVLPHGTGKKVKVAAFVSDDKIQEAKDAGADIVGNTELLEKIEKGDIDFDVLVTTPEMMRDLAKVARILWPKGLMPSPKSGTVTPKLADTINEIKKGRVEFKLDKGGVVHVGIGKLSFDNKQLEENFKALIQAINAAKPAGVKWQLIKKVHIAPTMGPGIQVAA
jgi:large subunit ribosomal protein L1